MCCLLTGLSFFVMVFFALLVVGHSISGTDGGLALVGLFGAAIVFFSLVGLRTLF
jgi:hypothetical protein